VSSLLATWTEVSAARMPMAGLLAFAAIRNRSGITIQRDENDVWVIFPAGDAEVLRCLRPVIGVQFLARRGSSWLQFGKRVPTVEKTRLLGGLPLDKAIFPTSLAADPPIDSPIMPVPIRIVRGGSIEAATAVRTNVESLAHWADAATTSELVVVRGARCGSEAVLLGQRLPMLAGAQRYWGKRILVPLGFCSDPELPEALLLEACGAANDEIVLLDFGGASMIAESAFEPLTRAGLRLAAREID